MITRGSELRFALIWHWLSGLKTSCLLEALIRTQVDVDRLQQESILDKTESGCDKSLEFTKGLGHIMEERMATSIIFFSFHGLIEKPLSHGFDFFALTSHCSMTLRYKF